MFIRFTSQPPEFQALIAATKVWQDRQLSRYGDRSRIDAEDLLYDRGGLMFGDWDERFRLIPSDEIFRRAAPLHGRMPVEVHALRVEYTTAVQASERGWELLPAFEARLLALYPRWGQWMGRINGRRPEIDVWAPEYKWTGLNPKGLVWPVA